MGIEIRVYKISVNHRNGSLLRCLFDNRSGMMNIHGSAVTTRTLTCRRDCCSDIDVIDGASFYARRGDDKVNAMRRIMTVVKLIQLVTHVLVTLAAINNLCHLISVGGASAIQKPQRARAVESREVF